VLGGEKQAKKHRKNQQWKQTSQEWRAGLENRGPVWLPANAQAVDQPERQEEDPAFVFGPDRQTCKGAGEDEGTPVMRIAYVIQVD
jgi:hypothetical protein